MADQDLNALLDGALDDFRDETYSTASPAAPGESSDARSSAMTADAGAASPGLTFDPLSKPRTSPDKGKGPSLPPRPSRKAATAASPSLQDRAASQQHSRHAPDGAGSSSVCGGFASSLPDLASTLQALAQQSAATGDAASSGNTAGVPDLTDTLRAAAAASRRPGDPASDDDDALLQELTQKLQGLGGDSASPEEMNSFVSSIMQQLLSKEVLHQSMKDIGMRYPQWLADNRSKLTAEELERYTAQQHYIDEICGLYETEPDNFSAIYEKLQQMQSCGTPPDEIVQELSPGLQFGEDGLPQLPPGTNLPGCCIQ